MKTNPNPIPNPNHIDDDFSSYYSSFQDNDDSSTTNSNMPPPKRKRRSENNNNSSSSSSKKKKTKSIARLLTSLAALDAEDASDRRHFDESSRRDFSLLRSNLDHQSDTMLPYYSTLRDSYSEESELARSSRRSSSSATSAAAVAEAAEDPAGGAAQGGSAAVGRRLWVKDRSRDWWDRCNHPEFPNSEFKKAFRMGRETFDMICRELDSAVAKEDTMLRSAIPVQQRVAVCIWRLATGEPLRVVSKKFGLGISTCHKLVLEVCSAIKTVLMLKFVQWPDEATAEVIKSKFESVSGMPNVIGSMYTTHIRIIAPKISVAAYFNKSHTERNQKTSYSITVQGVVDPEGVFTDVCIGWPGSMADDQVLEKSALYHRANAGSLMNSWIVGGASYPLMDWVLVRYTHPNLTWTQHAFNEKIGEVQRIANEAFMRLKGRWSCLQKRTEVKLQDLPVVLGACCVLHNICELRKEEMDSELNFELVDDEMVPENSLRSASSMQARDNIAHNLLHNGLAGTKFC